MKRTAKKNTLKRTGIGLLQHLLAALILIAVAGLPLHSYVGGGSIDGPPGFKIFPF